jgi:hypothetical protein
VSACIRCGQPVTKLISAPAIMFKGSGWYITDYSDKLKAPGAPESSDTASKPANGQGEQKNTAGSGSDTTASPSSGSSGSDATGNAKAASTSSSTAPATAPSGSSAASTPGKTSD